mmetsp:Transcript_148450/g.377577  ORF Transcript_148450/g.377577 Transcript_148450/m.377577 type:complete len:1830 (+) Transcript_148450:84-5573(+)
MSSAGEVLDVEGQYVVVHKVVALRTKPSITGDIWGRLQQDNIIHGVPYSFSGETWVRLSQQRVARTMQEVGPNEEVWALVDARGIKSLSGLGELLRRVSEGAPEAEGGAEAAADDLQDIWRVVPPRAVVRQQATTASRSKILGFYERGTVVKGAVRRFNGHRWLRIRLSSGNPANMLIDGSCLGLGPLLEPAPGSTPVNIDPIEIKKSAEASGGGGSSSSAEPKAKSKAKAKAQAAEDLGNLGKWLLHEPGVWASFGVVPETAVIRSLPSVKSRPKGMLKKGDIVEGEIRSEWLLLDKGMEYHDLSEGRARWILIDATSLKLPGIGKILERHLDTPTVRDVFSEAIEVSCPDRCGQACCLEVKVNNEVVAAMPCEAKAKTMFAHGLTPGSQVFLRFCMREPTKEGDAEEGKIIASSIWVDAKTRDHPCVWEEGDNYEDDLMGQPRAGCSKCGCKAFALDTETVSVNMDVGSARCARCGCAAAAHPIWVPPVVEKEKEKGKRGKKEKPAVPEEPLLIEKAVALPKETIFARWAPLDLAEGVKEWPRLSKSFQEVVAWSDLHSDMGANMDHLRSLPECPETVLLLAGDLATKMEVLESSLRLLKAKFGAVFYVPGNHELWVVKKEGLSSMHKFLAILELCERLEVHTRPAFISEDCAVCPLFSWYKDNLVDGFSRDKANIPFDIQTQWMWDITGRGDTNDAQQHEIADFFAGLNARRINVAPARAVEALKRAAIEAELAAMDAPPLQKKDDKVDKAPSVISMSHFIPRQEVYPGPRRLCGVMGCREIEDQVRQVGARCHIFGHSHIACDREVDAIRYVQHPLGYPNDYHRKHRPMRVWGNGGAPCKDVGEAKEPEATICKDIWKAFEKEIKECKAKELVRPPGRWSTQGSELWESGLATHDPHAERALRAELGYDAAKIAEMWSSRPPSKAINVKVTNMMDSDQSIELSVMNDLTVKQLKDEIVKQVGRGPASKINLSVSGENSIPDHLELSSIEGLESGLSLMGIDMSKGKEVSVKIKHKTSDTPQSLVVKVLDTCTILDVRKAIKEMLGEKSLSVCKIVRTLKAGTSNTFSSIPDSDPLNGRTELFFLGRPLPEATVAIDVAFAMQRGAPVMDMKHRLDSGSTVLDLKKMMIAASIKYGQGSCEPSDLRLSRPSKAGHGQGDELAESEQLWASETLHGTMNLSSPDASGSRKAATAGGSIATSDDTRRQSVDTKAKTEADADKNVGDKEPPLEFLVNDELRVNLGKVRPGQLTVADLRRRISEAARRGPASAIKLELPGLMQLHDSTDLFELRGGGGEQLATGAAISLLATGVDVGPGREMQIRIVHGSEEGQEMTMAVMDTFTIGEVRSAIMHAINETQRSRVRLVRRLKGSYVSLDDSDFLNGRAELIMMGRSLPPRGSQEQVVSGLQTSAVPTKLVGQQERRGSEGGAAQPSAVRLPNSKLMASMAPVDVPWTLERVLELLRALKQCCAQQEFKVQLGKAKTMDEKLARSHFGITFAIYCRDTMKSFGFGNDKNGFDAMFGTIFTFRQESAVVALTSEIELSMSLAPGSWFGIGPAVGSGTNGVGTPADGSKSNGQAGAQAKDVPSSGSHDINVVVTHATSEEQLTVTVKDNATLLDVRMALMAILGESKKSEVKLVKKVRNGGFSSLGDGEQLKGRKAFLVLGRTFGVTAAAAAGAAAGTAAKTNGSADSKASPLPAAAAPVEKAATAAVAANPAPGGVPRLPHDGGVKQAASTPQVTPAAPPRAAASEPLQVVVYIDRGLGIRSDMTVPAGTTVKGIKEQICMDDPTGQSSVDQFALKTLDSTGSLPDDTVLTATMLELELVID